MTGPPWRLPCADHERKTSPREGATHDKVWARLRLVPGSSSVAAVTLLALVIAEPALGWARGAHRVSIDVRGPLALVEVERPLVFGAEYGRTASDEVVVDLDLPEGALLAGAELSERGRSLRLTATAAAEAGRRYGDATQAAGWRAAKVPLDEGVDLRLRVAGSGLGEATGAAGWSLRYRFVAPLACRDGRLRLAMPGSLDPGPTEAEVTIRLQLGRTASLLEIDGRPLRPTGSGVARARTSLSVGRAWTLEVGTASTGPQAAVGIAFAAGAATAAGHGLLAVTVCRPPAASPPPAASRLILLVDRSRSVGPGGAAVARDLAKALVLALPPTLAFNAIFFDRQAEPLFPLPRSATLEALGALEDAVGLGSLRNGTDLAQALRRAALLTAAEVGGAAPAYWITLTDGALSDEDTPERLRAALAGLGPDRVKAAMLVLRPDGDDAPSPEARRALAEVPGRLGGLLRELPASAASAAAPAIVAGLRGPGDLIHPAVSGPGIERPQDLTPISIPPGAGGQVLARTTSLAAGRLVVRGSLAGAAVSLTAPVVALGASWGRALLPRAERLAWLKARAGNAVLLAPAAVDAPPEPPAMRGRMERDVVQRALGYAFLPRARACYLTRAIKSAADFLLKGRLRLELHLERGEMMGAAVRRSTLGRPDIEACLREAAFAVEVPRALHSDAPVIAALNLVFRPRTEARVSDAGAGDDAIDRILGPMPPPSDPLELLIEDAGLQPAP